MKRWRFEGFNGRTFYVYAKEEVDAYGYVIDLVGDGAWSAPAGRWAGNRIADDPEGMPKFEGRDGSV